MAMTPDDYRRAAAGLRGTAERHRELAKAQDRIAAKLERHADRLEGMGKRGQEAQDAH